MIWTVLAGAGGFLAPLTALFSPVSHPKLVIGLLITLLAVLIIGAPAGAVYLHMRGEVKAERLACDLEWRTQITEANDKHARALDAARKAAEAVDPTASTWSAGTNRNSGCLSMKRAINHGQATRSITGRSRVIHCMTSTPQFRSNVARRAAFDAAHEDEAIPIRDMIQVLHISAGYDTVAQDCRGPADACGPE